MDQDGDGLPLCIDPCDDPSGCGPGHEDPLDYDNDRFLDSYEMDHGFDPTDPNSHPPLGDVNCDGTSNNLDAMMIFQYSLGNLESLPCEENSDVHLNAILNNVDAMILFQWALGNVVLIPFFP